MTTDLYRDVDIEKIYTFSELKEAIIDICELEIEPTDDVIINDFINPSLVQNGGSIEFLNNSNNDLLKEINKQADDLEADRYLNQYERDMSVKEIYLTREMY